MHVITCRPHEIISLLVPTLSGHNYMQLCTRETCDVIIIDAWHLHSISAAASSFSESVMSVISHISDQIVCSLQLD